MNKIILLLMLSVAMGFAQTEKYPANPLANLQNDPTISSMPDLPKLHATADKGLKIFADIAKESNEFKSEKLAKSSDADKATLDQPIHEFFVRLDSLKNYKYGNDPENLINDAEVINFPVTIDNDAVGEVTVALRDKQWEFISVADARVVSLRKKALEKSADNLNTQKNGHFLVKVPAMNIEFIGFRSKKLPLQLTPLVSNSYFRLEEGVTYPAAKVFGWLAATANSMEDVPH